MAGPTATTASPQVHSTTPVHGSTDELPGATPKKASKPLPKAVPREERYAPLNGLEKTVRFVLNGKVTSNNARMIKGQAALIQSQQKQIAQLQRQRQADPNISIYTLEDFKVSYFAPEHNNRTAIREKQDTALFHEMSKFAMTELPSNFRPEYMVYLAFDNMVIEGNKVAAAEGEASTSAPGDVETAKPLVEFGLAEINAQSYDGTTTVPEPMHQEFMIHYHEIGQSWMQEHLEEHPEKPFLGVFGGSGREGENGKNARGMTDKAVYDFKIVEGANDYLRGSHQPSKEYRTAHNDYATAKSRLEKLENLHGIDHMRTQVSKKAKENHRTELAKAKENYLKAKDKLEQAEQVEEKAVRASGCEILDGDHAVELIHKERAKEQKCKDEGTEYKPGEFWPRQKAMVNFYNDHLLGLIKEGILTQGKDEKGRTTAHLAGADITHVMSDRLAYLLSVAKMPDADGHATEKNFLDDGCIDNPPFKYCNITLPEGNDKDVTFTRQEEFNTAQRAKLGDEFQAAGLEKSLLHGTIEKPELPADLDTQAAHAFTSFSKAMGGNGSEVTVTKDNILKGGFEHFKSLLPDNLPLAHDAYLQCKRSSIAHEKAGKSPDVKVDVAFFKKLLVIDTLAQDFAAECVKASDRDIKDNGRTGDLVTKSTGTAKGAGVTGIYKRDLDVAADIFKQHIVPEVEPYLPEGEYGHPYAQQSFLKAHIVNGQVPEMRAASFPRQVDGKYYATASSTIFKTGKVPDGDDKTYPVEVLNPDGSVKTRNVDHLPKSNVGTSDKKVSAEEMKGRDYLSGLAIAGCNLEHAAQFDVTKDMMLNAAKYNAGLTVHAVEANMRRLGIEPVYDKPKAGTGETPKKLSGLKVDWSKFAKVDSSKWKDPKESALPRE